MIVKRFTDTPEVYCLYRFGTILLMEFFNRLNVHNIVWRNFPSDYTPVMVSIDKSSPIKVELVKTSIN